MKKFHIERYALKRPSERISEQVCDEAHAMYEAGRFWISGFDQDGRRVRVIIDAALARDIAKAVLE